jgi:hypothetical protein
VNATEKLTHCPEIFFEYPQYNEGYFEALLTNSKMQLTAVYLGDRSGEVIRDLLRQKKAAVFYGYHPSAVYSTLNATQISFPQVLHVNCSLNHVNCSPNHVSCSPIHVNCSLNHVNCSLNHVNCSLNPAPEDGFGHHYSWGRRSIWIPAAATHEDDQCEDL